MSVLEKFRLDGKRLFITGGSRGLGRAMALASAEAGADCLYAPGISNPAHIRAVVAAVAPKPVNVLVSGFNSQLSVSTLAALGVRRISVGSGLAFSAWGAFARAARDIALNGSFEALADGLSFAELNQLFAASGKNAEVYPDDTGVLLQAGKKAMLQYHLHSIGEEALAEVELGIVLYPEGYTPKHIRWSKQLAQPIPGPHSERLAQAAKRNDMFVVAGLVESGCLVELA